MSFATRSIILPGSLKTSEALRECSKCGDQRAPEGGVDLSPTRWVCARCWARRAQATTNRNRW